MKKSGNVLVWIDLEMTGLDPERERIIEAAVLITSSELEIIAEGPNLIINQPESILGAMDDWNQRHHGESGLLERVRQSALTEERAEEELLAFVSAHCEERAVPLAGNSVHHDRRFLNRYMPRFERFFHYRNVDVSTVKELVRRWYPQVCSAAPQKKRVHRALDDILESVEELRYYRSTAFK